VEVLKFVVKDNKNSKYQLFTLLGTIWGLWEMIHTIIKELVVRKMLGLSIGNYCRGVKCPKCPKFPKF
jgi:hypothetical protein